MGRHRAGVSYERRLEKVLDGSVVEMGIMETLILIVSER